MSRLLLENIDQVREYVDISASFKWEKIKPFLRRANDKYVIPALSEQELANFPADLSTLPAVDSVEIKDPGTWTLADKQALLLDNIRSALANFGYYLFMPHLITNTSNTGIHITNADNEKSAFEWMVEKERASYVTMGYESLENMLSFLEDYKTDFADWAASESYTELNAHFINTAEDFNTYVDISSRRLIFMKMKPWLMKVEENHIYAAVGSETYGMLKLYIKTKVAVAAGGMDIATVKAWNDKLLWFIERALANLTFGNSIIRLATLLGEEWIGELETVGKQRRKAAKPNRLEALKVIYEQDGLNYIEQLKVFFADNRDKYSPYTTPEASVAVDVNNADSGILLM